MKIRVVKCGSGGMAVIQKRKYRMVTIRDIIIQALHEISYRMKMNS